MAVLAGSATEVALRFTVAGDGTCAGAVYLPLWLTWPTVLLPPTTPFTFHTTAVLEVPVTVARNWRLRLTRTLSDDGEMATPIPAGAVTVTNAVFDTVPSVIVATTGTEACAAAALPLAVSLVAETYVVDSGVPPNDTTAPGVKPVPSTVRVNGPTGNDPGLTNAIEGSGSTVTGAAPLAVGVDTLVARTVTTPGLGTAAGAR